jgi:hypothetical protein
MKRTHPNINCNCYPRRLKLHQYGSITNVTEEP